MNLLEKLNNLDLIHCPSCGAKNKAVNENCSTCELPLDHIDMGRIEEFISTIVANRDAIKNLTDDLSEVELISLCALCLEQLDLRFSQKPREDNEDDRFDFRKDLTSRISSCLNLLIDNEFGAFTETIGNYERFTSKAITALMEGYVLRRNLRLTQNNSSCIVAALSRQKYQATHEILKDGKISYLTILLEEFEESARMIPAWILQSCGIRKHDHLYNLDAFSKEAIMLEEILFEKYIVYEDSRETPSIDEYLENKVDDDAAAANFWKVDSITDAIELIICNLEFIRRGKAVNTIDCCALLFAMVEYASFPAKDLNIRTRSLEAILGEYKNE